MRRQQKHGKNIRYTIVDVGAGLRRRYQDWLTEFSGLIIHAIEPHPDLANELRSLASQLEENKLTNGNRLHVHEFAASSENGRCAFHLSNDKSSSSTLPFATENLRKWKYPLGRRLFKNIGEIEVKCKTLHTFFRDHNIRGVTFLNIDTQGNALSVLEGLMDQADWNRIQDINVKVHTIDWGLYHGQTVNYHVFDLCRRRYFSLRERTSRTRGQEDILCFKSNLAEIKGWTSIGWSKRALVPMA